MISWEAVSAISTLVGTLVVVATAVFAVMQLKEMKRSRKLELMISLFKELSASEARQQRAFIYSELPKEPSQCEAKHFLVIDEVLSIMDMTWLLIQEEQIEAQYVFDTYGEVFIRLWGKVYPIVIYERSRRGDYYRRRSEALIAQIQKYFQRKGRPVNYPVYDSLEDQTQPKP